MVHTVFASSEDIRPERIDSVEQAMGTESANMEIEAKWFREEIRDENDAVRARDPVVP